jgi:hypothetical protein
VVTRSWTKDDAGSLTVESSDRARFSSPQKLLDTMMGQITLDPLAFTRQDAKTQLQTLVDALGDSLGFDPVQLDAERKGVFDRRTEVGREVKRLEGQLSGYPLPDPNLPTAELSAAALLAEAEEIAAENAERDRLFDSAARAQTMRERAEQVARGRRSVRSAKPLAPQCRSDAGAPERALLESRNSRSGATPTR